MFVGFSHETVKDRGLDDDTIRLRGTPGISNTKLINSHVTLRNCRGQPITQQEKLYNNMNIHVPSNSIIATTNH